MLPASPAIRPLPGERAFVGRMGVVAGGLAVAADAALWITAPGDVVSTPLFVAVVAATALVALACWRIRWERLPQAAIQAPVAAGLVLCALGCWNTGGAESPLSAFYLLIVLVLAYAGTLGQVLAWGSLALAVQLVPLAYEDGGAATVLAAGAFVRGVSALALAVAVQRLRHRVRLTAATERSLGLRDDATGIASEEALLERLGAEVARARRHDADLTVLDVEIAVGDQEALAPRRLHAIAATIAATLRGEDLVARSGERSFTIVLPGADVAQGRRVAARVLAGLERLGGWRGHGCRAGVAEYPRDGPGAIELRDAARAAALDGARHLTAAPPAPAAPAPHEPVWPVRHAVLLSTALVAAVLFAWFVVPLVTGPEVVRPAVAVAAMGAASLALALTVRHVRGAERRGWALILAGMLVALPPAGGAPGMLLIACGLVTAAGRGWRRDDVRVLDAGILVASVAGLMYALIVLPGVRSGALAGWSVVAGCGGALGTAIGLSGVVLLATTVPPRRRPDIWLVLLGLGIAAATPLPYAVHSGGTMTMVCWWEIVVPLATLPSIAACQMRRRMPRRSLQIDIGETDPNPALWLGTILMLAGIFCSLAVDGDIPPVVATFLAGATALRTLRFQVVQRQRQRYATAARHSDAVRDAQQRASLEALARALEARDGYTGRHGEETVGIAVRVADALGLEPGEIDEVRTVALLHDIGKIGIPNDILHKPGPLDAEEWERMREHPVIGERILRVVPGLERVARAVRHEHERWDGGGYPDGIAGEEIPLASRITLVCDAWHAMTSDRPYRRAMPAEDAVAQLLEHSGSQFDRAVVRALLGVLERDGVAAARAAYQAAA